MLVNVLEICSLILPERIFVVHTQKPRVYSKDAAHFPILNIQIEHPCICGECKRLGIFRSGFRRCELLTLLRYLLIDTWSFTSMKLQRYLWHWMVEASCVKSNIGILSDFRWNDIDKVTHKCYLN